MSTQDETPPAAEPAPDELALAYMSIATLKAQVDRLERENKALREEASEPHPASPGWSGDSTGDGYNASVEAREKQS